MRTLTDTKSTMRRNGILDLQTAYQNLTRVPAKRRAGCEDSGEALPDNNGSEIARKIEQSIAYMLEHLNQRLEVATLAALARVSPSHFFALFKRRTGCPPIDYFIRLRMQHARELLDAGSLHVKDVAEALGYEDPFYFSRVFKAVNRIPPSRYRALQKQPSPVLRRRAAAEGGRGANGNGAASVSWPANGKNQNSRIVHSL